MKTESVHDTLDGTIQVEVMNQPSDEQLKMALAKMLPDHLAFVEHDKSLRRFIACCFGDKVLDTELLHLCWVVEESVIDADKWQNYEDELDMLGSWRNTHATWQQRVITLAKVKGIAL